MLDCYLDVEFEDADTAEERAQSLREDPKISIHFNELTVRGNVVCFRIMADPEYLAELLEPQILENLEGPIEEHEGEIAEPGVYFR
jgi:hypothetical protein